MKNFFNTQVVTRFKLTLSLLSILIFVPIIAVFLTAAIIIAMTFNYIGEMFKANPKSSLTKDGSLIKDIKDLIQEVKDEDKV